MQNKVSCPLEHYPQMWIPTLESNIDLQPKWKNSFLSSQNHTHLHNNKRWTQEAKQQTLACCDSWGRKEKDTTEWLIWSDLIWSWEWNTMKETVLQNSYLNSFWSECKKKKKNSKPNTQCRWKAILARDYSSRRLQS